ncbi:unnamed protein product, partial [Schistosoma turkestanicum]
IVTSNAPLTYPKDLSTDLFAVIDAGFARNPFGRPTVNQLLNYTVFACLIDQQQLNTMCLEENNPLLISSSMPATAFSVTKMYENIDKSLKCQLNLMKYNRKSSFKDQKLLKIFRWNKINSSVNHKKMVVVGEVENEQN